MSIIGLGSDPPIQDAKVKLNYYIYYRALIDFESIAHLIGDNMANISLTNPPDLIEQTDVNELEIQIAKVSSYIFLRAIYQNKYVVILKF